METKQHPASVIAKLMGFDEEPPQQPFHGQGRVLSEDYLQKAASIGFLQKRSASRMASDRKKKFKDTTEVSGMLANSTTNSSIVLDYGGIGIHGKSEKMSTRRNVSRPLQKLKYYCSGEPIEDFRFDSFRTFSKSQLDLPSPMAFVGRRSNSINSTEAMRSSFTLSSRLGGREQELSSTISEESNNHVKERKNIRSDKPIKKLARSKRDYWSTLSSRSSMVRAIKESPNASPLQLAAFVAGPEKKHFSDTDSLEATNSGGNHVAQDGEAILDEGVTKTEVANLEVPELSCFDVPLDYNSEVAEDIGENYEQDMDFSSSSGEVCQCSPDSVLESRFKERNSSCSECCDSASTALRGLWMQLQLLKSEFEETQSLGPGMVVSSDEDSTIKSFDCSEKNMKLVQFVVDKESRDFSYLEDVLKESGFHGSNVEMDLVTWNSLEHPLSSVIFETLEKNYCEHVYWSKSERRFLFDRINLSLMEILRRFTGIYAFQKPVRDKLCCMMRRDMIREEIWKMLVSQEKEASRDLSEKAVGNEGWIEASDDSDAIVTEIENGLFDDLVAEFVIASNQ